ncbi:hypothetical protein QNH98_13520 [Myroides sp. mNGS23_01]|nr:hypothetical protein [Myroides sp. mNGS23_01]WHT38094.1 hypothetical protein QNH98_13520 [Myroides sp. mNGS23_01]
MKRVFVLFGLILSLFVVTSCSTDDNSGWKPYPVGGLTMVNGYGGSEAIWYIANGRLVQPPYQGLIYKGYDYIGLYTGNRSLDIITNQNEKIVDNARVQVMDGQGYTSFVGGKSKDNVIHFITNDQRITLGEEGNLAHSGLRFFNLTGEDLAVNVKLDDEVVFANRNTETEASAKENEKFIAHASKTYTVSVQDKDGKEIAKRNQLILEKGRYFSLILVGSNSAEKPYYIGLVKQF